MIFGMGTDMIEIERVVIACEKNRHFVHTVFTEAERIYIKKDIKKAASNFAVKEAVVKMFGTGFGKIKGIEIECLRNENGAPYINLYGDAEKFALENQIQNIFVSITHTDDLVSAYVIGEKSEE